MGLVEMAFYVYEVWHDSATKVHRGSCSHCNNGEGQNKENKGDQNGKWHGAFPTYREAKDFALTLGHGKNTDCEFCTPQLP